MIPMTFIFRDSTPFVFIYIFYFSSFCFHIIVAHLARRCSRTPFRISLTFLPFSVDFFARPDCIFAYPPPCIFSLQISLDLNVFVLPVGISAAAAAH